MTAHVPAAKPYKGLGMEGGIAKWYAKLTCTALEDSKKDARRVAEMIPPGSKVLDRNPQSALRCGYLNEDRRLGPHAPEKPESC